MQRRPSRRGLTQSPPIIGTILLMRHLVLEMLHIRQHCGGKTPLDRLSRFCHRLSFKRVRWLSVWVIIQLPQPGQAAETQPEVFVTVQGCAHRGIWPGVFEITPSSSYLYKAGPCINPRDQQQITLPGFHSRQPSITIPSPSIHHRAHRPPFHEPLAKLSRPRSRSLWP